ncbi:membrane-bound lytic murein transglycosylase MltF [Budvicia aquatica]|uniref:Membrane-bound lytic murein transglycosylase F n=1 Tax=Budvicia aquatica TaxID=82979 RepID=A0A2C6DT40_9GAMM|nr:membrane-bound lytic murein transglycosylase MltF [Budvicia aquatica]MBP9642002.1 membrane-bound lytic murein transglycosylase MltF [Budvicia sp.]PHI31994.1 membrane-bound lytic murein transglycosylase MltF [Budvicia aquatica]GKX51356.1 membrane-bound lytic murein transglycosylase F [Budvicia aquatica]VFS53051.1 Membrane-bound lytic murein transglycosylase F precursor [Budvicia aquatica]
MKPLKIGYLFIGVVTLLVTLALWPMFHWHSNEESQIQKIQARGVLNVATLNATPYYYKGSNGPGGLDYELAKLFAEYLGVKLNVETKHNITNLFPELENQQADILAAGLIYNPDRMKEYSTGPAYYSVSQQLVYRQNTPKPKSLENLKGQLTVVTGAASISTLHQLKKSKYPELAWNSSSTSSSIELLKQVADGELDYTIADSVTIAILQRVYPNLAVAFDITEEEPVMWYVRNSDDNSLNAAMLDFFNQIIEDGTLAKLEEKYLGHVGEFDYVDTKTFLDAIDNVLPGLQPHFEKYATKIDWRLAAAIAYQESHWDPLATSPTGVRGIMMLTRNTAESLGVTDRLDPEQSIKGGITYLQQLIEKIPKTVPEDDRIWFALVAYNMGYAHMLDARSLTAQQGANPDSWADVKKRLKMLSQKQYYSKTRYGYARGHQAYQFVENIRRYRISLIGYLQKKESQMANTLLAAAQETEMGSSYPAVKLSQLKATTP